MKPFASGASTASTSRPAPTNSPHAFQRPVPARRDDQPIAPRGEIRQPRRELRGVALRAPPIGESQIESLRELREMQPNVLAERLVERMEHVRTRPADRLGERLALVVRLARAVLRALRLRQHHPRPVRQQLRHRRHVVEHERRQRLGALDEQPVGDPLEPVAEPVGLQLRPASGERADRVVRDQLAHRRDEHARRLGGRELRRRRELAERLDLLAPVLEADRAARVAGEDVDDAAAHRELAAMLDQIGSRVAQVDQPVGERVGGELQAGDELERRDRRRAWGSGPASPRARARPPRTHPSPPAADGSRRRGGRRSRGWARCPRTAAPPTRGAIRRVRRPGTRRSRRRAPPPRAGPGDTARMGVSIARASPAITASSPASACASIGRARSNRSRSNGSDAINASERFLQAQRFLRSIRTARTGLAALRRGLRCQSNQATFVMERRLGPGRGERTS